MEITINNPYMLTIALILMISCIGCLFSKPKKTEEIQHDLRHDSFYSISNRKNK